MAKRWPRAVWVGLVIGALALVSCQQAPTPEVSRPQPSLETPPQPLIAPEPAAPSGPSTEVDPEEAAFVDYIAGMDLREKVAGLVVATIPGTDPARFRALLETSPVAGFLLTRGNVTGTPETTRALVASIQDGQAYPLILAVDQEGGPVVTIRGDSAPGARTLGRGDPAETRDVFSARNALLASIGANVNFGVVADVTPGSSAYIHSRSFGSDPNLVAAHVAAALEGRVEGVAQTLKHFPGHGMVTGDSHREIPQTALDRAQWRLTHAVPFQAGIDQGAELLMMGHLRELSTSIDPASLSNDWVDIARDELGFDGVIITDDLSMLRASGEEAYDDPAESALLALIAGNDLILVAIDPGRDPVEETYTRIIDALVDAVVSGQVPTEQVDQSLLRVLRLRSGLATPAG